MIRPKPDIPERVPVLSFPTPEGQADLLFYEIRDGSLPKNKEWSYGDPHPDSANYPHHELVFVTSEGSSAWQRWYYAAARENQHLYNWQVSDTSEWPQLTQTFVLRRADFSVTSTYQMPPLDYFPYPLEWAVTGLEERPINDEVLASLFVTVVVSREKLYVRQVVGTGDIATVDGVAGGTISTTLASVGRYIECPAAFPAPGTRVTAATPPSTVVTAAQAFATGTFPATVVSYVENELIGREFDADINDTTPYRRAKVPAGSSIPSGIQPDGTIIELQPVNSLWSIKTTKQAAGLAGSAVKGKASRTFQIVTNWAWPAVLDYIKITPVYADNTTVYSAITGYITAPVFAADAYSGPCLATIIETWTSKLPVVGGDTSWDSDAETSPYLEEPTTLLPKSITFRSPLLDVVVPECLHDYIEFFAANFQHAYPATNHVRWPGSVVAEVTLQPHQGGWMKRVMIVNAPSAAGTLPDLYLTLAETFATSFRVSWANLTGTTALKLDVAADPTFRTGFLPGYNGFSVLGNTTHTVTPVPRGIPYYVRLTATRTIGASTFNTVSNTVVVMCPPQPEITLYTPGADGVAGTADDIELTPVTGTFAFGQAQTVGGVTKQLVIRNPGLLPLTGLVIDFDGPRKAFYSVVGSLPASIAPGEFAVVNLRLLPDSAVGAVDVTMTVTSNAANIPSYAVNVTGTAVQPEIDVYYGVTPVATGSTVSLGNVNTGSNSTFTFTINNTGNGPLSAVVSASSTPTPGDAQPPWQLVSAPSADIPAGGSATFAATFAPSAGGARTLNISISNNDPTGGENPYLLTLSATGVDVGRIDLTSPDGADMSPGGSYYFGFSAVSTLKQATFTIRNVGTGALNSLSAALSGTNAADFSFGSISPASIPAGGTGTITVGFTPSATDLRSAVLTFSSSDPDQPTYAVNITGTGGTEHEIQVESPVGTNLTTGGGVSFGSILTGSSSAARRFTIRNVGNARLTFDATPVTITGTDAAKFFVTALAPVSGTTPPSYLDGGESTYFDVTFTPGTSLGPLTATINIGSNDHDEDPFVINLTGYGYNSGSLQNYQASSLILGQPSTTSDADGSDADSMSYGSYGGSVAVSASGRVAVADTQNHRVMIWNSYASLATGAPADFVLGQSVGTSSLSMVSPIAVAWYGQKLLVGDTGNNRILLWNNPLSNATPADLVLGQGTSFTTSTSGISLTKFKRITSLYVTSTGVVVAADPDNHRVMVWTTFPAANGASAAFVLGQPNATTGTAPTARTYLAGSSICPRFYTPTGVCVSPTDGKMYVADTNHDRVVVYASVPSAADAVPTGVLFQSSLTSADTGLGQGLCDLPVGVSANTANQLVVADASNRRALLFYTSPTTGSLPGAALGQPDFVTASIPSRSGQTLSEIKGLSWFGGDLLVRDDNRVVIFKP
jgi:hypothetical protein